MTDKVQEILDILQEECGELVVAASKVRRFGIDNAKPNTDYNNREHLEEELGDLLAMVDIMLDQKVIDLNKLETAKVNKIEKLKKWSNIFTEETNEQN